MNTNENIASTAAEPPNEFDCQLENETNYSNNLDQIYFIILILISQY